MESNITEQELPHAEPALAEPHFDEEATVLSARPVVPLDEIRANTRPRRPWVFGLAIAGALLLGITATAFYFSRQSVNSTAFNDSEIASGVDALPKESDRPNNSQPAVTERVPIASVITSNEEPPISVPSTSVPKSSRKPVARLVEVITSDPGRYSEKRIREERKAARHEEKERRREARREMRDDKSSDDLLRIREIFEGRRKP